MLKDMRNLEQELKLQLDEREYEVLAALTSSKPQLQVNYYFYPETFSPDVMVRVREKNGRFVLGYKQRLQQHNGVTVCDERECEISADFAQSMLSRGIRYGEINGMLKTQLDEDLRCVGKTETYRTAFDLERWHLELDKNVYLGKTDYELECECEQVQQLTELENYLAYTYGIVVKYSKPKSQRFCEALNEKI